MRDSINTKDTNIDGFIYTGSPLPTNHLRHVLVAAKDGTTGKDIQLHYTHEKVIGNGSFGVVYQAKLTNTGENAAIKKVLQDKRFKVCLNRKKVTPCIDK